MVRRAVLVLGLPGRFGLFGDGFRTFSCGHREEKIEVGSVPSGPNVGVELFGRGGYPVFVVLLNGTSRT